ncbi:MAG: TldD/PmbA family protein [Rikenellaceae bacterium]|jgi:TldD protein|nr:TldD/PmbA family protein [Rikenellaceae bacterium]
MNKNKYLKIFGVTEAQMKQLVGEGLKGGGSWCDLYFENTLTCDLLLRDGSVSSGAANESYGCGIRVLQNGKTAYAYSESTAWRELLRAARAVCGIASSGSNIPPIAAHKADTKSGGQYYPIKTDWREKSAAEFVSALQKLDNAIRSKDSRVQKVIAILSYSMSDIMMYNSLGELTCDTKPMGSLAASVIFMQNGKSETKSVSRSFRMGAEMIGDALIEELADMAVEGLDASFEARRPKGGEMPVVMAAGASGILLHEAMGHAFEADFNRKGQSIFADKMGKRVAKRGINIIDDATIPGNRGALNYDDEGVTGQKTYMVEDGVLKSYLHDRISAEHFGVAPTGNGRRESFRYNPIPRMRCTYMESGSDGTLQDLIGSVRKGIFVDQFANGQVKIGEGDFSFYVKSGYTIVNGRLDMPVKDINIIGNGPKALADITAVAGDLKIDDSTWTCGKEQSVSVSCGIPSVLVKKLTVGGI